jgi:GNAT superfamily N-acetyltransferase
MGPEGDLVPHRFARGCRCFAVWIGGAVAGYGWLSTGPEWVGELQLEITPRPGEGYIWNCVTLSEHRRKGVFRSLLIGISDFARKEGMKRLWVGSVAIPAEKAVAPSGFEPALFFSGFRFGGMHLLRVAQSADRRLAREAASALGISLGIKLRRSRFRRH